MYYILDGSESSAVSWVSWFCSLPGNEVFAQVPDGFIEDDFNLTGLSAIIPYYSQALNIILDLEESESPTDPHISVIQGSAETLYGLIHARYLLTKDGIAAMHSKYVVAEFGVCPRHGCGATPVLPCGLTDIINDNQLKMFCPRCVDIYNAPECYRTIDGAFFGTTFPHLFLLVYPKLIPSLSESSNAPIYRVYEPKIFGFAISERSIVGPRMGWLRSKKNGPIAKVLERHYIKDSENKD